MPVKIYYLDDEILLSENFSETFSSDDVVIKCFSEPKAVIEATIADPPDIFFIDYRLPNTTGDVVAKKLPKHIPKALITGDINFPPGSDFIAVFQKPIDENTVQIFIDSFKNST